MYRSNHNTTTNNFDTHYISFNFGDSYIYGGPSTAIVIGQMQRFYILNGNHFEVLKNKTFFECIEYFKNNPELQNKRSDKYDETDSQKVIEEYKSFKKKHGYK